MSGTGLWNVQLAFYSRLTGDATLMALLESVQGVYDGAPGDTAYPHIEIGDGDEVRFRTFGSTDGHDDYKTIRIYTQDDKAKIGFKEGLAILDRVQTIMEGTALTVTAHTTVMCNLQDVFQFVDTDGITRQIAATYRVITQ